MKILLSNNELHEKLHTLLMKYIPLHSQQAKIINNTLMREALYYLLGMAFAPEESLRLSGYVLLAHISGLKLYLSISKDEIALFNFNNERNDYDLNDQAMLLNLQGWRQIEFLPILISFQLIEFFKNSVRPVHQMSDDKDINAIQKVLLEELWITANAFRIVQAHSRGYDAKESKNITEMQNRFVEDFLSDLQELSNISSSSASALVAQVAPGTQKDKDNVEVLFPCGITAGHAIYLSLFCSKNICDIRIFNAGLGFDPHRLASAKEGESRLVLPYYLGSIDLANSADAEQLANYLQRICYHSYICLSDDNLKNNEIITSATNDIYNLKRNFKFAKDVAADQEQLVGFPQQSGQNTCVTYSFFAWLYCRDGQLSYLKHEASSEANSIYSRFIAKLIKFAATVQANNFATNNGRYSQYLSERAIQVKQEKVNLKEAVIFKLKVNVKNFVLSDKEQELYTPLDGKYLDSPPMERPFPLYEKILEFIQKNDKQSIPVMGDAGTGKTQFAEHIASQLILKRQDIITVYIRLANPVIEKPMTTLIKENLTKLYRLSEVEAELILSLGETDQKFCFILDGVDELLAKSKKYLEFVTSNGIFSNFNRVNCIFLSRIKVSGVSDEELQRAFLPIDHYGNAYPSNKVRTLLLQPFGDNAKNIYIHQYLKVRSSEGKEPTIELVKHYRNRINAIQFMEEIIGKPILLMMTMTVLDYLELYYKNNCELDVTPNLILQDLYNMYILNLFIRARDEKPGPKETSCASVIECYLGYCVDLATIMHDEKDTSVIYYKTGKTFKSFKTKLNKEQYGPFFCDHYDPTIFGENEEGKLAYQDYRVGFHGCYELLTVRPVSNGYEYAFYHPTFIDHFFTINQQALLEGRRKTIQEFIDQQIQKEKQPVEMPPSFNANWQNEDKASRENSVHQTMLATTIKPFLGQLFFNISTEPEKSLVSTDLSKAIWVGKLPNSDTPIAFEEHYVTPNGDCGFTALGVDRKTLSLELLALKDKVEAHEFLAEEILNAFITYQMTEGEEGLKPEDVNEWGLLFQEQTKAQQQLEELIRKIKHGLTENTIQTLTLDPLIDWLKKNQQLNEAQALEEKRLALFQAEAKLQSYCKKPEVFEYYVNALGDTSSAKPTWLGYKSALLYARQANLTLYLWREDNINSRHLVLIDYYIGSGVVTNEIHMLHTSGFTHFNLLTKSVLQNINQQAVDSVKCISNIQQSP